MKKYIILILIVFSLAWCKKADNIADETGKNSFYIEVKKVWDFKKSWEIVKNWKIMPSSLISMKSQSNWQVSKIYVKEWDSVKKWQLLATLSDTIASYNIKLSSARNAVQRSRLSLESSKIVLNKSIEDAKLNLARAQKNYDIAKKDAEQTLKTAKNNLDQIKLNQSSLDLSSWSSISRMNLDAARKSLDKQKSDYQNKITADTETINGLISSARGNQKSLKTSYIDILNFADELYWISPKNKHKNADYETYLGARDFNSLQNTKNKIQKILDKESEFLKLNAWDIDKSNLLYKIASMDSIYNELIDLLNSIHKDLNNSVESVNFSQNTISWLLRTLAWYQNSISQKYSMYLNFKNQSESFLKMYEKNQKSILESIKLAEENILITEKKLENQSQGVDISYKNAKAWFEKTSLALEDKLSSLTIALQGAKNNLKMAIDNKSVTLAQLQNAIKQAQISYNEIAVQTSKLSIKSPVTWRVSSVKISAWEDVFSNSPLFDIIQDWELEIRTAFTQKELFLIAKWMEVEANYLGKIITWTVYSISDMANKNLTYDVRVLFDDKLKTLWGLVELKFHISSNKILLPINLIEVRWNNKWIIKTLKDWKIHELEVDTWKLFNTKIEIVNKIDPNVSIIKTNVENFDSSKFELKVR